MAYSLLVTRIPKIGNFTMHHELGKRGCNQFRTLFAHRMLGRKNLPKLTGRFSVVKIKIQFWKRHWAGWQTRNVNLHQLYRHQIKARNRGFLRWRCNDHGLDRFHNGPPLPPNHKACRDTPRTGNQIRKTIQLHMIHELILPYTSFFFYNTVLNSRSSKGNTTRS